MGDRHDYSTVMVYQEGGLVVESKVLWSLSVDNLENVYDQQHGTGSWEQLDDDKKDDYIYAATKALGWCLDGEIWEPCLVEVVRREL